ncbi:MAG: hypothetical protein ACOCTI_01325 [Phycisphaeraceae bacterium]
MLRRLLVSSAALALCACATTVAQPSSDTAAGESRADWYTFQPTSDNGPSVIGMEDWLDAPAGKHGAVLSIGDRLVFEDGTPVKFWGINLGGSDNTPSREMAEYWAERYPRYGINAVRIHKPWDELFTDYDSTKPDPEALERLDYFCNELRKRGIYYTWSLFYHHRLRGRDFDKLKYPEEIKQAELLNIYGIADYLPDVQGILIEATVNLLNHENPYTGLTYANDPALACVEFQNEASLFFWSGQKIPEMPSYQRDLSADFSRWLRDKYGSQEALVQAWGEEAMDAYSYQNESLDKLNIWLSTNSYEMAPSGLEEAAEKGLKQRLLDNAEYLHEIQNDYYTRFRKAVRGAGYRAPLVGSCWRGQGGITEYYNLRSDWLVGIIDRHNYHGGLSGWRPRAEEFSHNPQINEPGSGLFSSGLVQAADRPYAFSEWATVFPNEYALESPSIIAIYGLGLQGWDASYQFASRTKEQYRGYSPALHEGNLLWNIERPQNIGLYPALARLIYRGDVQPGPVISARRVSMDDLRNGELPFGDEWYSGWKDVKVYHGPMPGEAMAADRVVVEFVDQPQPSQMPDMDKYLEDGVITSATKQLKWDVSREGQGFFTVDTPGTKAVVGFRPDQPQELGGVTIDVQSPKFAAVYVTSLAKDQSIDETDRLLVTVMARSANTGMKYDEDRDELLALGEGPILLEPVQASVDLGGRPIQSARLLDHDGRATDREATLEDGRLVIDGTQDKTMYYEVALE